MNLARIAPLSIFTGALILFLLIDDQKEIRELIFTQPSQPHVPQTSQPPPTPQEETIEFLDVLDLPDEGDINVVVEVPKETIKKPLEEPEETRTPIEDTPPQVSPPPVSEPVTKETFPTFKLDYSEIGLAAYLQMAEKIGKLYVILEEEGRFGLGPAISFKNNKLEEFAFGEPYRKRHLADSRPYWVTDPELHRHLASFNLPLNHLASQLVLFLRKSFDEELWRTLEAELSERDYKLSDIASVKGQYEREAQNIFIFLETAETKSKETIEIGTALPIPCDTCS